MRKSRIALLALAVVLFGAAAVLGVYLATEPGAPAAGPTNPAFPAASADPQASVSLAPPALPPELPPLAGPGETPSPEWRKEHPTIPAPVPNAREPIAAPPPRGVPAEPARREDAILDVRRKRFADQMERMNQRNAQRGGIPADAGARPPDRSKPTDRRSTLSTDR